MDDLISRQAAIDAINTWDKFGVDERGRLVRWHEGLEPYVHLRDVLTAIAYLPPAQPEHDCVTCRYNRLEWDEEPCDSCTMGGESNHWKPSAQPEIIRCRDCKHYDPYDSGKAFYCFKGIDGCYPDDFCSYGERKDG